MKYELDDFQSNLAALALQATAGNMNMLAQNIAQQRAAQTLAEQQMAALRAKAEAKQAIDKMAGPKRGRPRKDAQPPVNGAEQPQPPPL